MISFRYHLFTIVAIFLAIALGIVMGATFVQGPLVDRLRSNTQSLRQDLAAAREEIDRLRMTTRELDDFVNDILPFTVGGRLTADRVVILTQTGGGAGEVGAARAALSMAGATIEAQLQVSPRMAAGDDGTRRDLAEALGVSPDLSAESLTREAARLLAARLASGPASAAPGGDLLTALLEAGFLDTRGAPIDPGDLPEIGGPGTIFVVVGGGTGQPEPAPETFLVPFLDRAVAEGTVSLAGQGAASAVDFVALVRDSDGLVDAVSTVDNVDQPVGEVAVVLALQDLIERGLVGHYGVDGDRLLPVPPAAAAGG